MKLLKNYLNNTLIEKDGIFYSEQQSTISYPEEGNSNCFQLENNSFWFKHRNNCIKTAVKKYTRDKLFFDIGGGNGFVAKGLQDAGFETVLLEPGLQGCQNAKKRGLPNIICSTLEEASLKKESIPAIGLFDVVEHIEDDLSFIMEIGHLLMQKGFLYITVPAYSLLWSKEDDYAGHFKRYTIKTLNELLKKTGFSITYTTYFFSILPLPIFLTRTLPDKLGIQKKASALQKHEREHQKNNKLISAILEKIWKYEQKSIELGKTIPVGSSCLIVAQK